MTTDDMWIRRRLEDLVQEGRATFVPSNHHPLGQKNGVGKEYDVGNGIHIICWKGGGVTVARCSSYDNLESLREMGGTDRAIRILERMGH